MRQPSPPLASSGLPPETLPPPLTDVAEVALHAWAGGAIAAFAVLGGVALAFAWSDARAERQARRRDR
jgi:hypothetical protein